VHKNSYQAARTIDNGAIGAVANFRSQEELLLYVEKQKEQAEEVVVVYEAEPLGYVLYRALKEREMSCYVCAPDSGEQKRKRRKKHHRNPDFNQQFVQLPQWQRASSAIGTSTHRGTGTMAKPPTQSAG
jgi:hypothetical protein